MTPETAVAIFDYVNAFFLDPLLCISILVCMVFMVHTIWRDYQADKKEQQKNS